ncbi:MAG TPA: arginase family protein [Micromonosporaceae bacterium]|nr:arginase family protein [Micromonosporaceae bacterium]
MLNRILVPYHLDEYLPDLDVPVGPNTTVTADLAGEDVWSRIAVLSAAVAEAVHRAPRPLVVSGDCLTALGTVTGLQRAGLDPAVVWFDAHGDVQTLETTASGYPGGLSLRLLCGYRTDLVADPIGLRPVPEERAVLVDARDLDPAEADYLATAPLRHVAVAGLGPEVLPDGPIYLHVDLDVLDSADVPGLRFPASGGPSRDAVAAALSRVVGTGRVCAIGLACTWRPGHDAATAVGAEIIEAVDAWT